MEIIEQLRRAGLNYVVPGKSKPQLCNEAADEIDRLNAQRRELQAENEQLKTRIARSGVEAMRRVSAERERCADNCADLAYMMEYGAGERNPGGRLRQAEAMCRSGEPVAGYFKAEWRGPNVANSRLPTAHGN